MGRDATPQASGLAQRLESLRFGFLLAVLFDQFLMLGYAAILLSSGSNTSAYYFAACILLFAFALGYFSLSAARTASPNLPTLAVAADA